MFELQGLEIAMLEGQPAVLRRGRVLVQRAATPPHQLWDLMERYELSHWGLGFRILSPFWNLGYPDLHQMHTVA